MKKCKHKMDESTMEFVKGKGYVGVCKKCGVKLIMTRRSPVKPRNTEHMSKKQRLKQKRESK